MSRTPVSHPYKVYSSVPSLTTSPAWSDLAMEPRAYHQSVPWAPATPPVSLVPLPGTPRQSTLFSPHHSFSSPSSSARSIPPSLHPVLKFDPSGRLLFNFTHPFPNLRFRPLFPPHVMNEQAIAIPTTHMYINFPGFPRWSLEIYNPTGVTIHDVLTKLYELFHRRVGKDEFASFPHSLQAPASKAFSVRTSQNPAERAHGIKRIDFVFPNLFFVGLSLAADGHRWDINLASAVA